MARRFGYLALHVASTGATAALIFSAPAFAERPFLVSACLTAIFAVHFVLALRWFPRSGRDGNASNSFGFDAVPHWFVFAAISLQALFIFAPFYFSDDSVRHIFDGVYLLRGVDVYTVPPIKLGALHGLMPNHPHLPTVYLPVTQAQAMLGALVSERYGFLLVYHLLCALMIAGIFHSANRDERKVFAGLVFSPFFLIASASRHADAQGLLLVLLCLLYMRASFRFRRAAFALGFLAALLPGLKPEGAIWCAGLAMLMFFRTPGEVRFRTWSACLAGVAFAVLLQAMFARIFMFPTWASLEGFRSTAVFFSNWFTAYNPIIALRSGLQPSLELVIREYRSTALLVLAGILTVFFIRIAWKARRNGGGIPAWWASMGDSAPVMLLILLAGVIMSRAVWNPWYFLWCLPALFLVGRLRIAAGLLVILPLFYLPVIQLRAAGNWDFSTFIPFYFFATIALLLWILLTGMGPDPLIRRIWHPDKNHP